MMQNENEDLMKAYDLTYDCVQCGYCLPACPTYQTMKKETHSPRGRINLVKLAAEGKLSVEELSGPIDLCLGCRACETACPTNVQYGKILEHAKTAIQKNRKKEMTAFRRFTQDMIFKQVFPRQKVMNGLGDALWLYQKTGMKSLMHTKLLSRCIPKNLDLFDRGLSEAKMPFKISQSYKSQQVSNPKYEVAFFTGCVMEAVFQRINELSIRLLELAGCKVTVVKGQTCCGALHAHSGEENIAKSLARKNIEAFEKGKFDFIVNNAGGCGAMLKEYSRLFEGEPVWLERAKRFAEQSVDISVILNRLQLPFKKEMHCRVTYQPSCHMTNVQKVTDAPMNLIQQIKGIDFQPLQDPNFCCGSAGIYNIVHFDASMDILDVKMNDVEATAADLIVTTNPGCLLQMKAGIEKNHLSGKMKAVHLVELLAEACGINESIER